MSVRRFATTILLIVLLAGCLSASPRSNEVTARPFVATDCLAGLNGIDLNLATIADLRQALADGRITSLQLVDAYLARIAAFDQAPSTGPLNSIRHLNPTARDQARVLDAERAAGHVRGPLHGIPILLKDNINTFDEPTTAGSIALELNVPPRDATVTRNLRDAGMIILGKTNMVEFAAQMSSRAPSGYSTLGGQVINAYTGGTPFGSSSGSGVAGSMAFAAVTLGTETSASIVGPSYINSLVGVKPTLGFVSRAGVIPVAHSFDSVGPMARNVADAAAVLDGMAGADARDSTTTDANAHLPPGGFVQALRTDALRGTRVGYVVGDDANPELAQAMDVLRSAGATLVAFDPGVVGEPTSMYPYEDNEFKWGINDYLAHEAGPGLPVSDLTTIILYNQQHSDRVPYGQDRLIASDATPGDMTFAELTLLPSYTVAKAQADAWFADNDLDVILHGGGMGQLADRIGFPHLVVPLGYADNRTMSLDVPVVKPAKVVDHAPYGVGFFGPEWSDARLLSYAYAFEQASKARIPPTVLTTKLLDGICT